MLQIKLNLKENMLTDLEKLLNSLKEEISDINAVNFPTSIIEDIITTINKINNTKSGLKINKQILNEMCEKGVHLVFKDKHDEYNNILKVYNSKKEIFKKVCDNL